MFISFPAPVFSDSLIVLLYLNYIMAIAIDQEILITGVSDCSYLSHRQMIHNLKPYITYRF